MLTKSIPVQVKTGPQDNLPEGTFTAYASCFNNVDSVGDVVMPGAFDATLAEWAKSGIPIPLLFAHNMHDPDLNLGHVLTAAPDGTGLKVTCALDLDNPKSMQTYRLLKGRRINQMSFAYDETDSGPGVRDGQDCWEIRAAKIYEVSVCQVGANQETSILAVKSLTDRALWEMKVGRTLSSKNETLLRDAHQAIGTVLEALDGTEKSKPFYTLNELKGFTANPLRPSLLEGDVKHVGEDASGTSPSCHTPPPDNSDGLAGRGASSNPSATTAKVRQTLLDIQLLEGEVA